MIHETSLQGSSPVNSCRSPGRWAPGLGMGRRLSPPPPRAASGDPALASPSAGTWRGAAGRLQPLLPEGLLAAHSPRRQAHPALCLQVTPFPEAYREPLHAYKISEQDTDVRANVRAACPPSAPRPTCPVPCNEPGRLETLPGPRHRPIYPTARAVPWLHPISPVTAGLSPFPYFLFPAREQKLLGKLCEQNKVLREQERLVQQLRAEKVRGAHSWGQLGGHICGLGHGFHGPSGLHALTAH